MKIYETFRSLNDNIEYCLLKGNEDISKSFSGDKDFDILTFRKEQHRLQLLLINLGFRQVVSSWHKKQHGTEHYVLYEKETDQFHHIHVHYCIIFGKILDSEYELPYTREWINLAKLHDEYPIKVLPGELVLVFEMVRSIIETHLSSKNEHIYYRNYHYKSRIIRTLKLILFKNKRFESQEKFANKAKYYNRRIELTKFERYAKKFFGEIYNEVKYIYKHLLDDNMSDVMWLKLKFRTKRKLKKFRRFDESDTRDMYKLRKYEMINNLSYRSLNSGGVIISLIGADGVGKSTMSKELVKWLRKGRFTAVSVHLGEPKGLLLSKIINHLVKLTKIFRLRAFKTYLIGYDSLIKAKKRAENVNFAIQQKNKGCIVITDRYPLKEFWHKESKMDSPKIHESDKFYNSVIKVFNEIKDYPDSIIFLTASENILQKRREKEININSKKKKIIMQKNQDVINVASELDAKIFDTGEPWDDLYNKVRSSIWEEL